MTQEEIIEMARQAGWSGIYTQWAEPTGEADWSPYKVSLTVPVTMEQIEAFTKLVAAKATASEREACAKVCEDMTLEWEDQPFFAKVKIATMMDCALAIRARGEA
jgi:hypothetical protein